MGGGLACCGTKKEQNHTVCSSGRVKIHHPVGLTGTSPILLTALFPWFPADDVSFVSMASVVRFQSDPPFSWTHTQNIHMSIIINNILMEIMLSFTCVMDKMMRQINDKCSNTQIY